jgi:hypothetical protein
MGTAASTPTWSTANDSDDSNDSNGDADRYAGYSTPRGRGCIVLTRDANGTLSWDADDFVAYEATGVDVHGRRFRPIRRQSWMHAQGINLYRGTRWGVRADGSRTALERIFNW